MHPIKFSIVLPVHNGGEYVKTCVRSILSQTYTDFNLLILDNCSSDGTSEWLCNLNSSQLFVYRSDHYLSIEQNWARVITSKRNEFMMLIGHDDILEPDYLETIKELILEHPLASIYNTHFDYINKDGTVIRHCKPMDKIQCGYEFLASMLSNQMDLMGTGFTMRSKDYDAMGGIPTDYPNLLFADLVLFFEITNISYKVTSFRKCFSFRLHQSTTSLSADVKLQNAFANVISYFISLKKNSAILNETLERYGSDFIMFYCKALSHRMLRKRRIKDQSITVKDFISKCVGYANQLSTNTLFDPYKDITIRMGSIVDSNLISRELFLMFKKIYSDPIV